TTPVSSPPRRSWSMAARSGAADGTTTTRLRRLQLPTARSRGELCLSPRSAHRLFPLLDVQGHLEEADLLLVHGAVGLLFDVIFEDMQHGEPKLDSRQCP